MTKVFITTLGGLGMFILGMKMMTEGLQMTAGKRIKSILSAVSSNRVVGCLTGSVTRITDKTRVLVIDYNGFYSGLIVDEVLGLKHFLDDEYSLEDAQVDEFLLPYTHHVFRRGRQTWAIFSLHKIADSPQFLQAAV